MAAQGIFNAFESQKWRLVKKCFYINKYRYVQIMLNVRETNLNDFEILDGQEQVMADLD